MLKTFLRRQHPSYDILSLLADGELSASEAMTVNAHLAECRDCREEVDFMVDLRGRLQALTGPAPPRSTLPDILGARAMGERRILDVSDEPRHEPTRAFWRTAAPVAAMVSLVAVSFAMFAAGSAEAGLSSLEFDIVPAGQPFGVEFKTPGLLAGSSRATVVAETYGRYDPHFGAASRRVEAALTPRGAGTFTGSMALPSTTTFARFTIESPDGRSDPAGRKSYVARRADGQPTFDALANLLQYQAEAGEVPSADDIALLTRLYGDNPYAWLLRHYIDLEFGRADADTNAEHYRRLAEFGAGVDSASAEVAGGIVAYAMRLGWGNPGEIPPPVVAKVGQAALDRLRTVAPSHPELVGAEALRLLPPLLGDPPAALREAEDLWLRHGQGTIEFYQWSLHAALLSGDGQAIIRWIDRWTAADAGAIEEVGDWLAGSIEQIEGPPPEPLLDKVRWLIDEYGRMAPMAASPARERSEWAGGYAQLFDVLGTLLERSGRLHAAYETRLQAVANAPTAARYERLGDIAIELAQPREGVGFYARARELWFDASVRDRLENKIRAQPLPPASVEAIVAEARAEVRANVFSEDAIRPSGPVEVRSLSGPMIEFAPAPEGSTIVYFFESAYDTTGDGLSVLAERCEAASARGISVRVVADRHPDREFLQLLDRPGCSGSWVIDGSRRLRRVYDAPMLRQWLVLDPTGVLFYRGGSAEEALVRASLVSERG